MSVLLGWTHTIKPLNIPVVSITNTGSVKNVVESVNVFVPKQEISFTGSLFKPNTRLYAFFDGKDVSSYIKPTMSGTESMGDPLISNSLGYLSGIFYLPNDSVIKFTQGRKEFKLTDSSKNDDTETTYSSIYFTYSGDRDQTLTQDVGGIQSSTTGFDPTVQSFNVLDSGGVYIDKISLYFLTKDNRYPILLQIREVVNDVVTDSYLSDSNYIIQPNEITVSDNGSVATNITFSSPVYLQEGHEYAIYLVTNAPATYALATCVYGETDQYNRLSTKDPRIGTMMKWLGSSAWLRDSSKGLKFNLSKCKFDTTTTYTLALDNVNIPTKTLPSNTLSTTSGTNIITVTDPSHSFNTDDFVTISGLPEDTSYGGISSNYINGIHRIDSVTWNTYTFSSVIVEGTEIIIPTNATSSVVFGNNVITDAQYQYDDLILNNSQIQLTGTSLDYSFKSLSGKSLDGSETPNIFDSNFTEITNKSDYSTSKVKKIASPYNEANINPGSAKSLQVNINFSTNNENVSPVIDIMNTNAILVENIINNRSNDETTSDNGGGIARYITKDITLAEQSNGIQVRFNANIQSNSNVRIYYKTLPVDSTSSLDEQPWVEMSLDKEVAKANNNYTFSNYTYTAYNLSLFKAFKTKVLMTSPDSTKVPLIRKYQAIAFQSISE